MQPYNRTAPVTTPLVAFTETFSHPDHPLRDCNGRATPYPSSGLTDTDSGYGDDEKPINWSSVLSLSSQSSLGKHRISV